MGRKTRESKYLLRPANKFWNMIANWAQGNDPNVKHYDHFLRAKHAAINNKKYKDAKAQYEEAIKVATRTGHLHHVGMFNERFADFHETVLMDVAVAFCRLKESVRWYAQWGADLKVELLSTKLTQKERSNRNS